MNNQLQILQSDGANSSGELEELRAQATKLEKSNRNTVALLDSKSTAHDKLAEELSALRTKTIEHRRETSNFTEQIQSLENSVSSAKLLESQLRAETEQQKRSNDWLDSELKTKTSEQTKFRKEKNAKIVELQRLNDDANEKIDLLQHTESNLRKRLIEAERQTEDTLAKIEKQATEAYKKEESLRLELETSRRLTELQKQTADTARRRVQELEEDLERVRDDAAEEISNIQAEIETERQDKEAAESRVEVLESHLEKLEANAHLGRSSFTGTPRPAVNGLDVPGTPTRAGSPISFTPGSSRSRGGLNYTQMYGDYTAAKTELEAERQRNAKLSTTLDELIQDMERKEPEAQEVRMEYERLQAENVEMAGLLASTREERDASRKESRKWQTQVTGFKREADLLKQQLRDLSAQIKILLVEVQIREEGVEFSASEREQLQQAARGEGDDEALEGMSDTAKFISQRLVSFRNVFELQEKNTELLKIVRQLGEQRESEEAKAKANEEQQTEAELKGLRDQVGKYKEEMKIAMSQSQSYIRERDMFRRMLSHRGQLPPDADLESMFGNSVNGAASPRTPHKSGLAGSQSEIDNTPSHFLADLTKALKDQQSQFDAYRRETATDFSTIKEQATILSKDKSQLQSEVARVNSQLTLAYERYQMLQANFDLMKSESKEMQKRSQSLAENAAKQDLRTQQVAEELVEAKSALDSMRYESAHLKAEKELWKNTQTRLSEDNRLLVDDRTRLSKALSDTQHLGNERELADMETRRRLQAQVDSQEKEARALNERLERELEASKNAMLRREVESEQHRTRVDDLMKAVANAKEALVASKAPRDQLEARLEEMKIDLRNAEERAQALQPKSTTQNAADVESGLNREQELGVEVADLNRELELVKTEVESARMQVEQYKAISQSSEEELQTLNDTHDQYREEMDAIVNEKDAKIKDLEQRVQDIMSELSISNEQLSTIRSTAEDNETRLENQKQYFETEVTRVKDEAERYKEAAAFHQEDLKAQADIAQQAQQSYESELVKHGEATKTLQVVRTELNQIRLEVAQYKADAESAKDKLSQNEEGWSTRREQYEKEMVEMKTRHDELIEQNKILHQQLESFSAQLATLQQRRAAVDDESAAESSTDASIRNLQGVIQYLRREKEIVDVQYELTMQESKRLRQQLDYSQNQLDETRFKLDQERQRQNTDERHAMSHNKLVETLNELNVFRESSVTLRNEARQAQTQLAESSSRVEELTSQIQPLQATIREIEDERDVIREQCKSLEEERNSWRERMQNILGKYDRIDPAELESLKEQVSKLQSERDEINTQSQSLQERVDGVPEEIRVAQEQARKELRERLKEQFVARSRELSGRIKDADSQNVTLKEQLDVLRSELETVTIARDEAIANARAASESRNVQKSTEEAEAEDGEVAEDGERNSALLDQLSVAQARVQEESKKAADAEAEVNALQGKIEKLQQRVTEFEQNLSSVNSELAALQEQQAHAQPIQPDEQLDKIKAELVAAQNKIEAMRLEVQHQPKEVTSTNDSADVPPSQAIETQVASIRADLESNHAQRMQALEEEYKTRVDNMRQQLITKLREGKETYRAQLVQETRDEHNKTLDSIKQEFETQIIQLKADHSQELAELKEQERIVREQLSSSKPAETEGSTIVPGAEVSSSTAEGWTPEQIKAFIANNKTAKDIFVRNLRTKLEQETVKLREQSETALAAKLQESKVHSEVTLAEKLEEAKEQSENAMAEKIQHINQLEEAKNKAEKSKEQAVSMESKKWTAKVSMAEARSRIAAAKIEVVSTAATETPERPVAEVWAIAKDAKAPPPAAAPVPPTTGSVNAQPQVTAAVPTTALPANAPPQLNAAVAPSAGSANGSTIAQSPQTLPLPDPRNPPIIQAHSGDSGSLNVNSREPTDAGSEPNAAQNRPPTAQNHAGTGPAALRSLVNQGSGIPTRGGANIRGMTQRGGRGGLQEPAHIPNKPPPTMHGQYQNQGQNQYQGNTSTNLPRRGGGDVGRGGGGDVGSRGRGRGYAGQGGQFQDRSPGVGRGGTNAMNPNAGQFTPAHGNNKRPHSPMSDAGGKRPRGGGGGN